MEREKRKWTVKFKKGRQRQDFPDTRGLVSFQIDAGRHIR